MKKMKVLALLIVLVMVSAGLSACGGDKKEKKPAEPTPAADTKSTTNDEQSDSADTNEEESADNTAENTEVSPADQLKAVLSIGYVGVDDQGTTVYWATDADVSFGVLFAVSADKSQTISFVGYIKEDGNKLTITDDKTGNSRTVEVQQIESDGQAGLQLTDEEGSITALFPVKVDDVIDAIFAAEAEAQ